MKKYEKMSNKELYEYYTSDCEHCEAFALCSSTCMECIDSKNKYVSQDIKVQPRWALIHSDADVRTLFEEFTNETTLPYSAFPDFLIGVVEV